jgi:hypothetical protein
MKDQIDLLARQGVDAARLDSSLDATEVRDVSNRLRLHRAGGDGVGARARLTTRSGPPASPTLRKWETRRDGCSPSNSAFPASERARNG